MRRWLRVLFGFLCVAVVISVASRPNVEVKFVMKKSPLQRTSSTKGSGIPPRATAGPTHQQIKALFQAAKKAHQKTASSYKLMGRLSTGEWLIGIPDGVKPREHLLSGHLVMVQDKKQGWRPFLNGRSIFRLKQTRSGWLGALTTKSSLYLRSPKGKTTLLNKDVGGQPQFSPSGKHLVYVHRQSMDNHTLLWRELATGKEIALASRGTISDPVVSPDERDVIYTSGQTGVVSLWRVDRSGVKTQLTNKGLTPGTGGPPKGFVPVPTGRSAILWAAHWLVFDAGEAVWAVQDDGSRARELAKGHYIPRWQQPGRSVLLTPRKHPGNQTTPNTQRIVQLPQD